MTVLAGHRALPKKGTEGEGASSSTRRSRGPTRRPQERGARQFWAEAADLLGQPGPGASGTDSPVAPAAEKPR